MSIAVTGIKPTGTPHIGNYLGMIRPALALAAGHDMFYFIADYHALTLLHDGKLVRERTYQLPATLLALGLDPERSALYRQSAVPELCELTWILSCVTPKALLNRAHAYKAAVDANRRRAESEDAGVSMGLYTYPILMSADILFPGAEVVPVGLDQKQHIEIADDIARAFNQAYGPILTVPQSLIDERVMTIPGVDGRKMSKSYGNVIPLLAPAAQVRRAVMRIKTDSRRLEEPKDPDTDLIFGLYRHVAPEPDVQAMRERYLAGGLGYGEAKEALADALELLFSEPRRRYDALLADRDELDRIMARGAEQVRERGNRILAQVRAAVGVGAR
jgi:tryptophanyl-tRNA synthetase